MTIAWSPEDGERAYLIRTGEPQAREIAHSLRCLAALFDPARAASGVVLGPKGLDAVIAALSAMDEHPSPPPVPGSLDTLHGPVAFNWDAA